MARIGHGQGPRGFTQPPIGSNLPFRKDERREGTNANVHRLATRNHIDLKGDHVVRRLEVEAAQFPRRMEPSCGLSFHPAERVALVLAQVALFVLVFLKFADLGHGQVHARLPQGFQLLPNGPYGPPVRHGEFVMNGQAHGSSPKSSISRHVVPFDGQNRYE